MSFSHGSVSFRMVYVPQELPADFLDRFQRDSAPPLAQVIESSVGWVGGRHVLDVPITEENSTFAGYLGLLLRKSERKVPANRLKAECIIEEQAEMKATGKLFVDRKTRGEIRKATVARLLPTMEPTLTGLSFVYESRSRLLYITATSDNQLDAFRVNWLKTLGLDCIPVTAETAAVSRLQKSTNDWAKVSFADGVDAEELENTPGMDFMTWLWFRSEAGGGLFKVGDLGEFGLALEGPLLLEHAGQGAHETALRKGLPTVSDEAKSALLTGKKLRRAKVMLARADEVWHFGFDAATFTVRGMKLPESKELLDPASRFSERMTKLAVWRDVMLGIYDQFVTVRTSPDWGATVAEMQQWVTDRTARK